MNNKAIFYGALAATVATALLTGCYQPPIVKVEDWSVKKSGKDYVLSIVMQPQIVADNGMHGTLKLFYSNGCRGEQTLDLSEYKAGSELVKPQGPRGTFTVTQSFTIPETVAGAQLQLEHWTGTSHGAIAFFDQAKVIDPAAQKKAEKAKCKPAPVERAAPSQSSQETAATIINLNGYLCGRVTDIYPRGPGQLVVHCVEYRNGSGRAKYLLNTDSAQVERLD